MTGSGEECRRTLLLVHALCEEQAAYLDRVESLTDIDALDWLEREKLVAAQRDGRALLRRLEVAGLETAFRGEPLFVECTARERSEALRVAREFLEGEVSVDGIVDRWLRAELPGDADGTDADRSPAS